jgi:hypothetical protein
MIARASSCASIALTSLVLLAGCRSCAGIDGLEIGSGGAGGAGAAGPTTGAAPTTGTGGAGASSATTGTEGAGASSATSVSASTGTGGRPCGDATCDDGQFCEVVRPPAGDDLQVCKTCGEHPAPPVVAECPAYCTSGCDTRCDVECPQFDGEHCDLVDGVRLDAKVTDMQLTCRSSGSLCTSPVTCTGAAGSGPGPFDCHVVCDGDDSCYNLVLDCSDHSGRCIIECRGGGCESASVICGANECIVCGDPSAPPVIDEASSCDPIVADSCNGLL